MCVGLPLDKKTVENQGWAAGRCGPPGLWVVMDQEPLGKSLLVDRRDLMSIRSRQTMKKIQGLDFLK